jgi:hypothetical protein
MNAMLQPEQEASLDIEPEQTSVLAVIAQGAVAGVDWEDYRSLRRRLHGDSLVIAELLYDKPSDDATPAIKAVAERLKMWVSRLHDANLGHRDLQET